MSLRFLLFLLLLTTTASAADRALLIGIEQYRDRAIRPAHGAERDAQDMEQLLLQSLGFPAAAIHRLNGSQATSAEIAREFRQWLIRDTRAGDRIFFYYAGHGSYLRDDDGDEKDGYDETIVPYDATPNGPGMIRDDQLSRWMAELAGRRVVMVFDSCHSGTIARSFGGTAAKDESARYIRPADSELQEKSRSRILLETSDGRIGDAPALKAPAPALIISAAGPMQTAHSMKLDGIWHGALTLALRDALEHGPGDSVPVGQLKGMLRKRIAGWQQEKILNGSQSPEIEWSAGRHEAESLFGEWESVPAVALFNPRSSMRVSIEAVDGALRRNARSHLVYFENETISYRISTNAPGYLYLMVFSQDTITQERYVTMLFPNRGERTDNHVAPPGLRLPEKSDYRIGASGLDLTVALLTSQPIQIELKAKYSWDEIFSRFDLGELKQQVGTRTRNLGGRAKSLDWQASSIPIYTTVRR
jgi:hypothetical protein